MLTSSGSSQDKLLTSVLLTAAILHLLRFSGDGNVHEGVASCCIRLSHLLIWGDVVNFQFVLHSEIQSTKSAFARLPFK